MSKLGKFLETYGVLVAFAVLFIVSALMQPDVFLKPENLKNLLNQNVSVGIIAIGMTIVIMTGGIDLSVGSLLAVSSALSLLALNKIIAGGGSESSAAALAILVCIVAGTAFGALNGFLVAYARVAPFVATLVGLVSFRSLCLALAQGGEIRSSSTELFPQLGRDGIPVPFLKIGGGLPLVITYAILLFLLCAFAAWFLLKWTRFGRYVVATGANERAAVYSAIPAHRIKFWAYTLLGTFTGLAAVAQVARMNSVASGSMGMFYELDAIAAVVIGGTSLRGGRGRIWATVLGVLLLGVISNMMVVKGVDVYWQGVVKGVIILGAVLLQRGREE